MLPEDCEEYEEEDPFGLRGLEHEESSETGNRVALSQGEYALGKDKQQTFYPAAEKKESQRSTFYPAAKMIESQCEEWEEG